MSPNHLADYGAVRRCVAEFEDMWASVPGADVAAEVPEVTSVSGGMTTPGEFVANVQEQSASTSPVEPAGQLLHARTRAWLQGVRRSAEAERSHTEALYERWLQDPAWEQTDLFAEPREVVLERLEQTVAGLALTISDERPEDAQPVEFRINWQPDGDGLGCWEGAPAASAFSLREAAEDNAELIGEFGYALLAPVAQHLLNDLRRGVLMLPQLARSERSTQGTTWLRWSPAVSPPYEGLILPELADAPSPHRAEEVLARHVPELARLLDEVRAISPESLELSELTHPEDGAVPVELERDRAEFAEQLVAQLRRLTGLPATTLVVFLAAPLQVIVRLSVRETVRRRAWALLFALRGLIS
jgi:hypothetical protein